MVDIKGILGDSRRYTLHSHTEFCDGRAQMIAFAAEAVKQGFTHYGFSPHSPVPIVSPCNMHRDNVPVYLEKVDEVRARYGGQGTHFLTSMEIDYLGEEWGPSIDYFQQLPLDYRIGSVHFIPSQDGTLIDIDGNFESFKRKMSDCFHDDIQYVVETYYSQSIKMVEKGGFDIIGHMDKVGHNASHYKPGIEEEGWYMSLADDLTNRVISSGLNVELNTKAYKDHGRFFPSVRLLRRLVHAGVNIVVNSDAHVPALINASRPQAWALLDLI